MRLRPDIPALIPQVYLHLTRMCAATTCRHGAAGQPADGSWLLPHRARVVIECDGAQHYADDQVLPNTRRYANPRRYAETVAEDRELRLAGLGLPLRRRRAIDGYRPPTDDFFDRLVDRHAPERRRCLACGPVDQLVAAGRLVATERSK